MDSNNKRPVIIGVDGGGTKVTAGIIEKHQDIFCLNKSSSNRYYLENPDFDIGFSPVTMRNQFRELLANGKVAEAEALCRERPSLLSFVLLNGLSEIEGGWTAVEKALEDATAEQSARLYRKIEYLSVIGNIAPMVGLLGTVIGMIFAFHQVAISRGSAGAGDLAEGIYQALVTTVGGLIVAIPSLGAFAVFRNRVDQLVVEASYMSVHAFAPLKRRRSGSQKPPPAPPRVRPQKD